jgi:hypothetical protein
MTTKKNGLLQTDMGRTGTHGTIYAVKRDPKLTGKDFIKDKNVHEFGFVNGSSYKGEWEGNKKHGFGVETSSDGTKYEGEWVANRRHGRGTLWVKKNKIFVKTYAGGWSNNKMEGQGVYSYDDGTVYKGNWHSNMRTNFGRLEYPNGDVYSGDWVDDVKQGVGTLFLSNGNIYEGYWVDNMKEGPGKFFYAATNKVYEGEWVEDSPRCGQFRDPNADEQKRFGKPLIKKSGFNLPDLMLKNTRAVLDTTVAETRNARAQFRGVDVATIDSDTINRAEQVFEEIDTERSGLVRFIDLGPVLEVLGVILNEDDVIELMNVLEINADTDISFPEAVDIASFYEKSEH